MKEIGINVINEVKYKLANELQNYVSIIKMEYSNIIPPEILNYLNDIKDFKNLIRIEQTNTISMFVREGIIYFPINAFSIIDFFKKIPGYGRNKNHKTYNDETIISNDNNYLDYIIHVFISGLTPLQFYEETLLHETTHLCGIGGNNALREGIAELKTRELALKHNLRTSACGYPKEVQIALEIQNIFGKEIVDKIAFARNNEEIIKLLQSMFGNEAVFFFMNIQSMMEKIFLPYYSKNYPGIIGPLLKAREYDKVDYSMVHQLINDYKSRFANKHIL